MVSDWVWKKLNFAMTALAAIVLLVLVFFQSNIEIKDVDLWLHIATGRYIVEHGQIPAGDVLSCTITGKPWINHEWLFQSMVASIYDLFGSDGLINLQIFVVSLTFLILIFMGYSSRGGIVPIFLLLLCFLVYSTRLTIRPDIFSLLFFVLNVRLISVYADERKLIPILFLLQVFWTNIHGFFIIGPILIFLILITETIKRKIRLPLDWNNTGRLNDQQLHNLCWAFAAVILACFVNPYGIKGAMYPLQVLFSLPAESMIFFNHILELEPPIMFSNIFSLEPYAPYRILIILSFFSFILNFRKFDIGLFLLWLLFLIFSLKAIRNLTFFSFAAYFVILGNVATLELSDYLSAGFKKLKLHYILPVLLAMGMSLWTLQYLEQISNNGYYDFDRYERKSEFRGITQRSYPQKAVDFLEKNHVNGSFFNDFNSGAYLLGRMFPKIKVYIDGRTEVYGARFFEEHNAMWKGNAELLAQGLEKYKITGALLNSIYTSPPENTLRYFYNNPDWSLVYFDYDAVIFLKNIPENLAVIKSARIDLDKYIVPKIDLLRLGLRNVFPFPYVNRSQVLISLGYVDKAEEEINEALKISTSSDEVYKVMGKIAIARNQFPQAFIYFRDAKLLDEFDNETRYYLGLCYFALNDNVSAEKQADFVLSALPNNPQALLLKALILAKKGKSWDSEQIINKVNSFGPWQLSRLDKFQELFCQINDSKTAWGLNDLYSRLTKDDMNMNYKFLGCNENLQEALK